jgi:hypothetical protein
VLRTCLAATVILVQVGRAAVVSAILAAGRHRPAGG